MSYPDQKSSSKESGISEAEVTLRLIASLPAPEGLADRVQAGLQAGLQAAPRRARVLAWPVAAPGEWLRVAAAAAIVFVVAGGGWGIYAHVQPGQAFPGIGGPGPGAAGRFSEGGAVRRPQTLVGPTVKPVPATVTPKPKAPAKTGPITASSVKAQSAKTTTHPVAPALQ